ncbi:MAG: iron chelate uptake ABC transporter family permease subunit [Polyangiaceae bacterium]|nr:iron chelate uptake ABC transporter family permease subunit [Polyangiaceae bacterium]
MMDALVFLGPALAICLVIASLHVYLGMHVLAREVIFVDLSLAQLAALGATVAALLTSEEEPGWQAHALALAFTILGAALFAFTRRARKQVSQEAIVGIVYAVASAVTVLVVSHSPHGAEHIKDILVGSLLNTTWANVWQTAAAYVVLGAVQLALAKRFITISWQPDEAEAASRFVAWWDFGFYVLFGLMITISVQFAGILLVFSYLIVPALITRLYLNRLLPRLFAGWGVATAGSLLGLSASWVWDFPTGAAIVAAFGALLAVAALGRLLAPSRA